MDKTTKILIGVAVGLGAAAIVASMLTPTSPIYYQTIGRQIIK
jgi:hypothetical protein